MQKLIFRDLKDRADIDCYLDKVEYFSGVRLPEDYVSRSRVVGVFLHERLVAGYMLVTQPGFRSLMFVPTAAKQSYPVASKNVYEMMEVNGLWIGPALRTPKLQISVWAHLIKDIFFCRKKYVLLLRNSKNSNMKRFTDMADPVSIYEGQPQLMSGEKTHDHIHVSYTTRWKIVLNAHRYYKEYLERMRRADQFAEQSFSAELTSATQLEYG